MVIAVLTVQCEVIGNRFQRMIPHFGGVDMTTMTTGPVAFSTGVGEVSYRIKDLLEDRRSVAQWWVDLTMQLDELSIRLMTDGEAVWRGLSDQLRRDAPHMSSALQRIDAEKEDIESELFRVRMFAGESAGDPHRTHSVKQAVRGVLNRLRRHEERTTQVLYETYERDLGGESA